MEPEVFLEQSNVIPLTKALIKVLNDKPNASDRLTLLNNAGINSAWIGNLRLESQPNTLAPSLVAAFKAYRISRGQPDYHPMVKLLEHLSEFIESYGLSDEEVDLFSRLIDQGQENFKALKVRSAVGRIESPKGNGIGTGVLLEKNLLLTCNHIFSKTQVQQAWVRLGYKTGSYGLEDIFELDMKFVCFHNRLDYALVRIKGEPPQQSIVVRNYTFLNDGQDIRLIHHPLGKPVVISDIGKIVQVGEDYIDHNISADEGSSGAPIFNTQWELVAIHRGHSGIGRSVLQGILAGIPMYSIKNHMPLNLV
ncbi:serine protease [Scytonema sp. UIC 10036]|uniref:trypsin-like peptidase domain-containing protein n=1 Tax=Scytonema sp. UIC 10036 TaxID=2304196 RepID=UPI0012DA4D25|nr:trypsin-like peptidase domain-containing protein [Scytonema sp. UIC 10036]MUG94936.1 serine protease [Scytonema sp. UIC 10036]